MIRHLFLGRQVSALLVHYSLVKKKKKNTQQLRKACHALQCSVKLWSLQIFRWLDLFSHHTYQIQLSLLPLNLVCQERPAPLLSTSKNKFTPKITSHTYIYNMCILLYVFMCKTQAERDPKGLRRGSST